MSNNICIILPDLDSGGAQKILHKYGVYESKNNLKVIIILLFESRTKLKSDNIEYICLEKKRLIFVIWDLFKFFKKRNFDYVITSLKHITIVVELIKYFGRFTFIHIARIANVYSKELEILLFFNKIIFKLLINFTHKKINKFICVSEGVSVDLKKYTKNRNIRVIYNPIDQPILNELGNQTINNIDTFGNYFIFIGRLSQQKNLYFLINSYDLFVKKYKVNYKLLIIGQGDEFVGLNKLVKNLNLHRNIIFLGFLENPYPYLKNSKLLLLSSLYEGLPSVLIEALYFDIPIVSINCQFGPSEIITNPRCGKLVETYNENLFADTIFEVLINCSKYKPVEEDKIKFNIERFLKEYHNFILNT